VQCQQLEEARQLLSDSHVREERMVVVAARQMLVVVVVDSAVATKYHIFIMFHISVAILS